MPDDLSRVAGVRFRNAGKIFYFHTAGMRLEAGEFVVVETTRGPEVAKVVIAPGQVVVNELNMNELKPILRLASEGDIRKADELRKRAEELLPEARRLGEEIQFPARIDTAEFTLDGRRLTFGYTADERVDYRDFIRRASDQFKARVDVRQMGARDRAKMAGGYGICGRELCCSNWLTTFPSISIRMAKEQELPLNPQKISGLCGRLLCCLSYEEEGYKEMRKSLPKIGQRCSTPTGEGKVIGLNIIRRQVTLYVEGQRIEVGDRDLGTVVRWDTSSKSGDPPPSISRAEAIAQGMIEATEEDLQPDTRTSTSPWDDDMVAPGPGRGRLPGGGPRRVVPARPPRGEHPATEAPAERPQQGRDRNRRRDADQRPERRPSPEPQNDRRGGLQQPRRDGPPQRPSGPASGPPQGRVFRRSGDGEQRPSGPSGSEANSEPSQGADGEVRRQARRRNRRGRGGSGPNTG